MTKISVLLPTRNRLDYLKHAVESVRRQEYSNWEIIISDNHSDEDIKGYWASLQDPRVKYFRTDSFVPVTENWNNALTQSSGDYVVMLGDDDALLRGYMSTLAQLVERYNRPDFVYTGALIVAYPGVMPGFPAGYVQSNCNPIFDSKEPFWLEPARARELVEGAMGLRMPVTFNMQHSFISRAFIESLAYHGPFFQSPYPDFYATNVALLKGRRILIYQRPLVAIGITPRSYGFFHFNKDEKAGMGFLQNTPAASDLAALERVILPGNRNNTSFFLAMKTVERNYQNETGIKADHERYRFLQIAHVFKNYFLDRTLTWPDLREVTNKMTLGELVRFGIPMTMLFGFLRLLPTSSLRSLVARLRGRIGQYSGLGQIDQTLSHQTVMDVFEAVDPFAYDSA
jgi:hypothetical protein